MNAVVRLSSAEAALQSAYELLRNCSAGLPNSEWLARMLASRRAGVGAMPQRLGLSRKSFAQLMALHYPGLDPDAWGRGPERDPDRDSEIGELMVLFLEDGHERFSIETAWIGEILAAGCMGSDHLWQDLGLWSRADLSGLIGHNFPRLKERNNRDMKWKKFFYKQLCQQEGVYTCRAPSCEVCGEYTSCFGPEI